MVLNFFQLRNHTKLSFRLLNLDNTADDYDVGAWVTDKRGDMWLATDKAKCVEVQASDDGNSPWYVILDMWDHDWAVHYRVSVKEDESFGVDGSKDFSIDIFDDILHFVCYNGKFKDDVDTVTVQNWKFW